MASDVLSVDLLPEAGGRVHRLRAFGHDLLPVPSDPDTHLRDPLFWGWYPLVPWTNRVPDGLLFFDGAEIQLPANYEDGSALHGHAYVAPWTVEGPADLVFRYRDGEFPWDYTARQHYALDGPTLRHTLTVTNDSDRPMPAGLGIHPWWSVDGGLEVHVPCRAAYHCEGGLAVGPPHPIDPADAPQGRIPWGTDQVFTDLAAQSVLLRWPGWGVEATLAFSPTADHVQLAAFEKARAVAVEPVTHAGDGHRRRRDGEPGAIDVIGPGETLAVEYRLTVRRFVS